MVRLTLVKVDLKSNYWLTTLFCLSFRKSPSPRVPGIACQQALHPTSQCITRRPITMKSLNKYTRKTYDIRLEQAYIALLVLWTSGSSVPSLPFPGSRLDTLMTRFSDIRPVTSPIFPTSRPKSCKIVSRISSNVRLPSPPREPRHLHLRSDGTESGMAECFGRGHEATQLPSTWGRLWSTVAYPYTIAVAVVRR